MMLRESFEEFMDRSQLDLSDWPLNEEELDKFLLDNQDCDLGVDSHQQRVAAVLDSIERAESKSETRAVRVETQGRLFDAEDDDGDGSESIDAAKQDIHQIVREAYLEVFDGSSTDVVVADPDRSCLFVQACWSRGIQASQGELTRLLLNARKASKIGKIEGVKRYRVSRDVIDRYLFASEVALRLLQDKHHFQSQKWITLDDVFCEPQLGKEFFELASSITPGFKEFDYRWAALSIRKGLNRRAARAENPDRPQFEDLGVRDRIRASKIPREPGFFWMKSEDANFYIGHNTNLREQMEQFFDERLEETLNCVNAYSLFDSGPLMYSIAPAPDMPVTKRDPMKRFLVDSTEPCFNVTKRGNVAVA